MPVNTINELITLLNQVDVDATVLAAIANDAADSVASGPSAGLVTTRLGSNVKNVQKVIADIENGIIASVGRPAIQEEGATVLANPATWNFVGSTVTVTDVSGVATITVDGPTVSKVGTPVDNQIGIWTGNGTIEGDTKLTFDGAIMTVSADAGPTINITDINDAVTLTANVINPGTPVAIVGTSTAHALRLQTNNTPKLSITSGGNVGIGTNSPLGLLTLNGETPILRMQDVSSSNFTEISNGDTSLDISVDVDNLASNSAITFAIDGAEVARFNNTSNLDMTGNGYITTVKQVNTQTGTAYTAALTDANGVITMDNGAGNTLTLDPVGTTAYPIGYEIKVIQIGVGATTIQAGASVSLNGVADGSGTLTAQYDRVVITHIATDTWIVSGDIGVIS